MNLVNKALNWIAEQPVVVGWIVRGGLYVPPLLHHAPVHFSDAQVLGGIATVETVLAFITHRSVSPKPRVEKAVNDAVNRGVELGKAIQIQALENPGTSPEHGGPAPAVLATDEFSTTAA